MTRQLLFDGQKSIPLDLNREVLWTSMGNGVPLSEEVRVYYERVGLLYRCVNIRATSLSKVPWTVTNDAGDTLWKKGEPPPEQLKWLRLLPRLLYKTEAALSLGSQAFWHKERNRVRTLGLRWFAPVATAPWWDVERGLTHFIHNTGVHLEQYPPSDMVYLWYQHPMHETRRDVSPAEAAMAAAGVLYNVDAFVSAFFQRGAIKATLLTVKGNPQKAEMERLKAWWLRVFSGIKNAFKTDVISADAVTPVVVGEGISELSNTELTTEKERAIVYTMGVPFSMIFSDAANFATAGQDEQNFYNSTIIPDCELIAEQLGEQLLDEMGLHLAFKPETMDVFQTDESEKAQSFGIYVSNGVKPSVVGEMLGLELPDGVEYADLDETPEPVEPVASATRPGQEPPDDPNDPALQSEMRRFRAWAKKHPTRDADEFHSRLLTRADKTALKLEMGGGADHGFFPASPRVTLPPGPITPDAYKSLLLRLDPDDEEADRKIRESVEARAARQLAAALSTVLENGTPQDATDVAGLPWALDRAVREGRTVRDAVERMMLESADLGVSAAVTQLERVGIGFDYTLANIAARDAAQAHVGRLIGQISDHTRRGVQQAVSRWVENGEPLPKLVKDLRPLFGRSRAQLIAATEVTTAYTEGNLAAWREAGFGQGAPREKPPKHPGCRCTLSIRVNDDGSADYVWLAGVDERTCPACGRLHNTVMGVARRADLPPAAEVAAVRDEMVAAMAQPSGVPVSAALTLPSGKQTPTYQEALRVIDGVHGDGKLPKLPVVTKSIDSDGQFHFLNNGTAVDITMNRNGQHPQLTLAHEVGHFLDLAAIGKPGRNASESDPVMRPWKQAVAESAAVRRLKEMQRSPERFITEVEVNGSRHLTKPDRIFAGYLLDGRELWARSYAQYIALRSQNPTMLAQLAAERALPIYSDRQWTDEDFAPIAAAIDELFKGLGWRL